jgi:hypothetical protein
MVVFRAQKKQVPLVVVIDNILDIMFALSFFYIDKFIMVMIVDRVFPTVCLNIRDY